MLQEQIRSQQQASVWNPAQPQRRVVFGQMVQTPPQPRPHQYIIPPLQYDQQRVPHLTGKPMGSADIGAFV